MSKEDDEKAARAAEMENTLKEADAKKRADAAELEERRKADGDMGQKLDKVLSHLDDVGKRMDAIEGKFKKADRDPGEDPEMDAVGTEDELAGLSGQDLIDAKNKRTSALADAQCRADSVASAFGQSAPRFMDGETVMEYRRRLLRPYQGYSPEFKAVDISKVRDPVILTGIESRIFADAIAASSNPIVPENTLEERKTRDASGRMISTFYGEPRAWMSQFGGHTMALKSMRTDFGQR